MAAPRDLPSPKQFASSPPSSASECKAEPGILVPVVDRSRCEGKGECVRVCPYAVFEVGQIAESEFRALSWRARFKLRVHGKRTALLPHIDACRACGLCVAACPEDALSLARAPAL